MGVEKYSDMDRLRVIVWATAVVTRGGGTSTHARKLFDPSKTGRESTMFNKCLAEGRPWPEIEREDGSPGEAVRVERAFPGTLIWLIHPIWRALELFPNYMLEHVFLDLLAMRPSVTELVLKETSGSPDVWHHPVPEMLQALHEEGSLDALLALMLLSRQAYCYWDVVTYRRIVPTICELVKTIACIQWMPSYMRQTFVNIIVRTITAQQPCVLTAEMAREFRATSVALDSSIYTDRNIKSSTEDVEAALEGSGVIHTTMSGFLVPPEALAIIQKIAKTYAWQ